MTTPKTHSPLFKAALLSGSLLLSDTGAVSPTLPYLAREFPAVSQATIQSFITMPALAGIAATLAAGALATKVGKRRLVLIGILLIILGGVSPLLLLPTGSFTLLLAARLLVGIGVGLLQPLTSSLIADFFHGRERSTMLGWQSSMVGAGSVLWSLLVAALMVLGWEAAFFVYLAALVIFALIWRFVPEPVREQTTTPVARTGGPLPWGTIPAALLMLSMTMGFQALGISTPFLAIDERHLTDGSGVSLVMTSFGVAAIVAGLVFGLVFTRLRAWTATVSLVLLAAGLATAGTAMSLPQLYVGAILVGLGFGTYMPFAITTMNERATLEKSALVTALVFTGASIGGFLAPYFFSVVGRLTGNPSASGQFATGTVVIIIVAVAATIFYQVDARRAAAINRAALADKVAV